MTTLMGLEVAGRPVLVAGGGPVAARRAAVLAADGAVVTVVAPEVCEDVADLVMDGLVRWHQRTVTEADVDGVWLVHAATDDRSTNADLCRWATDRRVWSVDASASGSDSGRARWMVSARSSSGTASW